MKSPKQSFFFQPDTGQAKFMKKRVENLISVKIKGNLK